MERKRNERPEGQRKPLRAVVAEVDQEILRLLTKRYNLLGKMRKNGRLNVPDEKFLRESWQNDVARVSRDPELSGRFFALMNQVSFLPRPQGAGADGDGGTRPRTAFNLAPPQLPVHMDLTVPLDAFYTRAWLYLACHSGQVLRLSPCLQNDSMVDFIQGLTQLGGGVTRDGDAVFTRPGHSLGAPDKVIFTGHSRSNFYFFVAHYLGRHGRVRFNGSKEMELEDFSTIDGAISSLGGRMVHIVPHSSGLPARLETSGLLPPGFTPSPRLPAEFLEALLLCAPFYERPFALDLANHGQRGDIMARVLPVLEAAGATFAVDGAVVSTSPSPIAIPHRMDAPMCAELALFIAALVSVLGGEGILHGIWPPCLEAGQIQEACAMAGWRWEKDRLFASCEKPLAEFAPAVVPATPAPWHSALIACLAASVCLRGGSGKVWPFMAEDADTQDFLRVVGCMVDAEGNLSPCERSAGLAWNAPSPAWALALAVAACAREGKAGWPLGNPGIVTALWPQFWSFYNKLPRPELKKSEEKTAPVKPRRRILTNTVVKPPEIRDEDWD